jgi:starch phosphorylase
VKAEARVKLGPLDPEDIRVQLYSGPLDRDRNIRHGSIEEMKCIGKTGEGLFNYETYIGCDESGLFGYSIRIMPSHPNMVDHFGLEKMRWIGNRQHGPSIREACYSDRVIVS